MRSNIETYLPGLAVLLTELWHGTRHTGQWLDMRAWLSGASASLAYVSEDAFRDVMQELEDLEVICTLHHRSLHRRAAA